MGDREGGEAVEVALVEIERLASEVLMEGGVFGVVSFNLPSVKEARNARAYSKKETKERKTQNQAAIKNEKKKVSDVKEKRIKQRR